MTNLVVIMLAGHVVLSGLGVPYDRGVIPPCPDDVAGEPAVPSETVSVGWLCRALLEHSENNSVGIDENGDVEIHYRGTQAWIYVSEHGSRVLLYTHYLFRPGISDSAKNRLVDLLNENEGGLHYWLHPSGWLQVGLHVSARALKSEADVVNAHQYLIWGSARDLVVPGPRDMVIQQLQLL